MRKGPARDCRAFFISTARSIRISKKFSRLMFMAACNPEMQPATAIAPMKPD
jgi:hypothetical protein